MTTETITWTKVAEGLPDADTTVLISLDDTHGEPTFAGFYDGAGWFDVNGTPTEGVIAWADMPAGMTQPPCPETQRVIEALDAMKAEAVDRNIAEGKMSRIVWEAQASLINPCTQVYFRAGLIACREYMARFVEAESPNIAASIRANWWPQLGEDFGGPRLLDFNEVADGGEEGPWTVKPVSPTVEALPLALGFLMQGTAAPAAVPTAKETR